MSARSHTRGITCDERGAVMLLGLFMAVFMVGLLYYVVGIGEAIAQRERMQDAADAAALSGAVLHARGMNTIALANMVMAALLAILVALKLAEVLAAIAIVSIAIAAFWAPGMAAFIPGLQTLRQDVKSTHDALKPTIDQALRTLHTLEHAIGTLVPIAAQARVAELVRAEYRPPADVAFLLPPRATLPTEDGSFDEVCDHASAYVGDLVELALEASTPPAIAGVLAGATADLAKADKAWFCGDGQAKPPTASIRQKLRRPVLPAREACSAYDPDRADYSAAEHCALCARAEYDEIASKHDRDTGACEPEFSDAQRAEIARLECDAGSDATLTDLDLRARDCGADGAYAQRAAFAREQCRPGGKHHFTGFEWMQREVERTYVFHHGSWRVQHSRELPGTTRRVRDDRAPCGDRHAIGAQWVTELHAKGSDEVQALCSSERAPAGSSFEGDQLGPIRFTEVVQLFGCVEKVTIKRTVARGAREGAASSEETPQRLAGGVELGGEDFQLRTVVVGSPPSSSAESVVALAGWRSSASGTTPALGAGFAAFARGAARSAFAQAEYYYAGDEADGGGDERASFLWNMRWTARLRRVRLPEHGAGALLRVDPAIDFSHGDLLIH